MSTFLKVAIAAFAVSAAASNLALAANGDGIAQACEAHDYTPHGVWDCR